EVMILHAPAAHEAYLGFGFAMACARHTLLYDPNCLALHLPITDCHASGIHERCVDLNEMLNVLGRIALMPDMFHGRRPPGTAKAKELLDAVAKWQAAALFEGVPAPPAKRYVAVETGRTWTQRYLKTLTDDIEVLVEPCNPHGSTRKTVTFHDRITGEVMLRLDSSQLIEAAEFARFPMGHPGATVVTPGEPSHGRATATQPPSQNIPKHKD